MRRPPALTGAAAADGRSAAAADTPSTRVPGTPRKTLGQ
ncbi:hypothetical protein GZL_00360 [Streptomyces sp. 769]|nr:hypothetical protein GZL_00360 [Streptomyces sp. 769]